MNNCKSVHCFMTTRVLYFTKDYMFHERTKHIDVRYHFMHEIIARGEIVVSKVGT